MEIKSMEIKSKAKQFQYEIQNFQEDCVNNIVSIFNNLQQGKSISQVFKEHYQNNQYYFDIQENSKNIDIMMETGTGKTFTFIKTIFELSKNFGYKKFIILIPSVSIREGTKSHLSDTKDYFKGYYANEKDKEIETFVYEEGNTSVIHQFINAQDLSVLIMTPSSFNSDVNRLNQPLEKDMNHPDLFKYEQASPKSYLECLKRLNPIIIIDEPHRFDGGAFKKYFEGFDNYYLRFGATFPTKKDSLSLSNVAYVLDSISSFRQNLVKKILVYTQDIIEKTDTLIGIEKEGSKNVAVVNSLINGMMIQRKLKQGNVFNDKSINKINKDSLVLSDGTIEKVEYALSDDSLKAMIKETIQIHFEKEEKLYNKGIKALTLFFIQGIDLFRGVDPKIKKMFEAEYVAQRDEILNKIDKKSNYYQYLSNDFDNDGNLQVHKGYFSGDKGDNLDEKVKAGVDEILKDKKKLLSFESPTRFIFSIWALQEGWDNPNVFTICKLSNYGSETSKLQQIGRGLRICVNQDLQRNTLKNLDNNQEQFWNINNLDVVVSSKEQGFVESIQKEILDNSFLVSEIFTEPEIINLLKAKSSLDDDSIISLVDDILVKKEMIIRQAIVDGQKVYKKSPHFNQILEKLNLPEEQKTLIKNIFTNDAKAFVQDANTKKEKKKVFIKETHLESFKNLWNTINKNAFYTLANLNKDGEENLIKNIAKEIESLNIEQILLQTIKAELNINQIDQQGAITKTLKNEVSYKSKVDYLELVYALSNSTKTPLSFVVKIFNALSSNFKKKMLCNNPKQAQQEMAQIIKKHLVASIKTKVTYEGINGEVLPNVFQVENGQTYLNTGSTGKFQKDIDKVFSLKTKWAFKEVIEYDSDFELNIIEKDPDIDSIQFFAKLPRLKIKTPLGDYNPDFCYAVKGSNGTDLFLIVEAKGYGLSTSIPEDEKAKIDFAKEYFKALNQHYQGKNIKISFKERIHTTALNALMQEN